MISKYDRLGKVFLEAYDLPFKYIDYNHFKYCLNLYFCDNRWTEWLDIVDLINKRYDGNPDAFLDKEYYGVKERVIEELRNSKDLTWFSQECDMKDFTLPETDKNAPSSDIYNQNNIGKTFLSIQMVQANFQTLKAICSSIVNNAGSYEDFIKQHTDIDFIINSKQLRQDIFGQFNPKRQVIAERWYMNEIRKTFESISNTDGLKLASLHPDELIYEVTGPTKDEYLYVADKIKEETGFDVKCDVFLLGGYDVCDMDSGEKKFTFFTKKDIKTGEKKLECIPIPYYKIAYKLFNGLPLEDEDYLIDFEGVTAAIMDEFEIKPIEV